MPKMDQSIHYIQWDELPIPSGANLIDQCLAFFEGARRVPALPSGYVFLQDPQVIRKWRVQLPCPGLAPVP